MKRFKVLKSDLWGDGELVFKGDTTQECFEFLKTQDMGLNTFMVEDIIDEIEVNADEFMAAFESGECPGDLQFF